MPSRCNADEYLDDFDCVPCAPLCIPKVPAPWNEKHCKEECPNMYDKLFGTTVVPGYTTVETPGENHVTQNVLIAVTVSLAVACIAVFFYFLVRNKLNRQGGADAELSKGVSGEPTEHDAVGKTAGTDPSTYDRQYARMSLLHGLTPDGDSTVQEFDFRSILEIGQDKETTHPKSVANGRPHRTGTRKCCVATQTSESDTEETTTSESCESETEKLPIQETITIQR